MEDTKENEAALFTNTSDADLEVIQGFYDEYMRARARTYVTLETDEALEPEPDHGATPPPSIWLPRAGEMIRKLPR